MLLGSLAAIVGLGALYRGLAVGSMSVVAPISATAVIVPVVVGVATGDRPSAVQAIGIAIAIAGVVMASREPRGARGRVVDRPPAWGWRCSPPRGSGAAWWP